MAEDTISDISVFIMLTLSSFEYDNVYALYTVYYK